MHGMPRLVLALAFLLTPFPSAAADGVCRPDALGTVSCPDGPRPKPRPLYRSRVQALERVTGESSQRDSRDTFVPSRETRKLGGTILRGGLVGPCRPDMLGNLNCR